MRQAAEAQDLHAQLLHDVRFHEIIVEASGNQVLVDVWRSLRVEARTLISVIRADSELAAQQAPLTVLHDPGPGAEPTGGMPS